MVLRSSPFSVPLQDLTNVPSDTLRTRAKALRAFSVLGRSLPFSPGKREAQLAASALVVPEGHDPTPSTPKSRNEGGQIALGDLTSGTTTHRLWV